MTSLTHYAQTLAHAASHDADSGKAFTNRLVAYLTSRGRARLLPGILAAYEKLANRPSAKPRVIVAKASAHEALSGAIKKDVQALGADAVEVTVDDSLVGGYIVRTTDAQIDRSYKTSLLDLYRRITT
jgi:F0F1-type ATP synthase delta subunit